MNLVNGDSCLRWAVGSMTHSTAFNTISDETCSTVLVAGTRLHLNNNNYLIQVFATFVCA